MSRRVIAVGIAALALTACTAPQWTAYHNVYRSQNIVLCGIADTCPVEAGQRLDVLLNENVSDFDAEWARDWCDQHGGRDLIVHQYLTPDGTEYRLDVVCERVDF